MLQDLVDQNSFTEGCTKTPCEWSIFSDTEAKSARESASEMTCLYGEKLTRLGGPHPPFPGLSRLQKKKGAKTLKLKEKCSWIKRGSEALSHSFRRPQVFHSLQSPRR